MRRSVWFISGPSWASWSCESSSGRRPRCGSAWAPVPLDSELCPEEPLALDVLAGPALEQSRIAFADGPPNAAVCLEPDVERIRAVAAAVVGD